LAIVAAFIAFLVRRPAVAYAGHRSGTQTAHRSWGTATQAATETPQTTPLDTGFGAKFVAANGGLLPISGKTSIFGRNDFQSILMPSQTSLISREHIRIEYENDEYYIKDLDSTNGTKINGLRIGGKGRFLLNDGDRIELADAITFTFRP
jgi:pSer/pThr/pTyr-binding forkhead associated (FHA) protein